MSTTRCNTCGSYHSWDWTEAFDKFGFEDGDGLVMTDAVVSVLEQNGYVVQSQRWGFHNTVITSIQQNGSELIPPTAVIGYDSPRNYLPLAVIELLDATLNEDAEVDHD